MEGVLLALFDVVQHVLMAHSCNRGAGRLCEGQQNSKVW
jgi:hypothetical protein